MALRGLPTSLTLHAVNGQAAVDACFEVSEPDEAPRAVTGVVLNAEGRIGIVFSVLATAKLARRAVVESSPAECSRKQNSGSSG